VRQIDWQVTSVKLQLEQGLKGEKRMKKVLLLLALVFSITMVSGAFADEPTKLDLKVGDKLYVCSCGKECDCDTLAMKPGKCVCGKKMGKGTVTKVSDGTATIKTAKFEKEFKTAGLYACACGKGCDCNTISQKPGKCVCGKPMKKVETKL
jgi:hypothetical protein